jgi:MoaA/NifB/PqqE/SkfB family radical SAM enzyme
VATTSKVYPCCDTKKEFSIGNVKDNSIYEIWNSDNIKAIRKSMLQGTPVESCQNCYKKEKLKRPSARINFNQEFVQHIHVIDNTNPDGSLPSTDIKFWDVRYNNLCNLSCRSCNPSSSSSWYQVHNAINPDKKLTVPLLEAGNNQDAVFDQMQKSIDQIDTIYFAGGEPAMIENFYKILELLIANNRTDVRLKYNLNMTRLTLKNKSLLNLWNKFKHVSIGASLDAEGDRAAYMRSGTVWKDIIINRNAIAENCPHVDFWVSATTGLINALHVPDFHQSWVEKGFIKPADFNIQLLFAPAYQSIINAPAELKQKIIDRYTKHLAWLTSQDYHGRAVHGFNSVIEMCYQPGHYDPEKFWKEVKQLDQYHGTNLLQTFPELCNTGL